MEINIIDINGILIAEVVADTIVINNAQDALDIMANCGYQGADKLIIHEKNIAAGFFDLKTRLAGDILQKFSNYNVSLAVVGDFSKYESNSLRDFIYESNKAGRINFVSNVEEAKEKLSGITI
jgi:hypothetical protein